ncbi:MAG: HAMP domain-containing histidine kinase [Planctomycetes bacterium]|nr:HAMP domain-containing histidine kinase [Planctomycetota bacterium]
MTQDPTPARRARARSIRSRTARAAGVAVVAAGALVTAIVVTAVQAHGEAERVQRAAQLGWQLDREVEQGLTTLTAVSAFLAEPGAPRSTFRNFAAALAACQRSVRFIGRATPDDAGRIEVRELIRPAAATEGAAAIEPPWPELPWSELQPGSTRAALVAADRDDSPAGGRRELLLARRGALDARPAADIALVALDLDAVLGGFVLITDDRAGPAPAADETRDLWIGGLRLPVRTATPLPHADDRLAALLIAIAGLAVSFGCARAATLALDHGHALEVRVRARTQALEIARRRSHRRARTVAELVRDRESELEEARHTVLQKARDLAIANRDLARRNREIESFYHVVSHELRTPLTSIREFTAILADGIAGPVAPEQRECLDVVRASCEQMRRCIDDLFDAARIETGKLQLRRETNDLAALLAELATAHGPHAKGRGIALELAAEPGLPPLEIDPVRIRQVVGNLIDNAMKFSGAGSTIRVTARATGSGQVEVAVVDQGCGIPSDSLERVFDRLHQVHGDPLRTQGGLGLGLALCRQIVELHGGHIRIESRIGEGTTVRFTLPVAPAPHREPVHTDACASPLGATA